MPRHVSAIFALVALAAIAGCTPEPPNPRVTASHQHPELWNPADIVRFRGKYVASELYRNRLAIFDDLAFSGLRHFDPQAIGKKFAAPHYLAVTPRDTLLISNGWGSSVVEIADLDGAGWKEYSGHDRKFNAPHGVCTDRSGWIYVGDSLNSRLVRFLDMDGRGFEEFADINRRIGYIRQMICADDGVWLANSYEKRPGINPGRGGSILRIRDFASGRAEEFAATPSSNTTAVLPLPEGVLWAEWTGGQRIWIADRKARQREPLKPDPGLGVPYGFFHEPQERRILVAHFGGFDWQHQRGGILELRY